MTYPWNAGEVLAAADLNAAFASKLPYSYGTATPSTTTSGFLWYDSNSTPAATKFWDGSAFVPFGGKILQVVRATDGTNRTTTSTSYIDANISVTITPQKSDSAIVIWWIYNGYVAAGGQYLKTSITDSSNNTISGAATGTLSTGAANTQACQTMVAYATPATTSATTYKGRFKSESGGTVQIVNAELLGQLYAIEVSA